MPVDDSDRQPLGASWAVREVDHLLSTLGHYTRFVAFSKWGLAVFAILIVGFVLAWPHFDRRHQGMRVSFLATSTPVAQQQKPGAPPRMENPVYDGINAKGQPFKVTGTEAIQQAPGEMVVLNMRGQLWRSDSSWVKLSADTADYFQEKNFLHLSGNVSVVDQGGYSFTTDEADVDTKAMHVVGPRAGDRHGADRLAACHRIRNHG